MGARLIAGDCIEAMAALEAASVDAVVTDPPYGTYFMAKDWDRPALEREHKWKAEQGGGTLGHLPGLGSRLTTNREDREFQEWTTAWAREALRALKPGAWLLAFGAPRTFGRLQCGIADAGFQSRDVIAWLYGSGFPKSRRVSPKGEPHVGSALKPAMELIALCRAPFKGSARGCHREHGTAGLNIDDCRIPLQGEEAPFSRPAHSSKEVYKPGWTGKATEGSPAGRWPANVVHDGSEEVVALFPEEAGGGGGGKAMVSRTEGAGATDFAMRSGVGFGDAGSAARFFYCAKASRAEREAGLDALPVQAPHEIQGRAEGSVNPRAGVRSGARANVHTTVKPIDLMRWLVRVVVPRGGVVLDPFMGSGTTGIAAALEGRGFFGIEREEAYFGLAERRIDWWARHPEGADTEAVLAQERERAPGQLGLFEEEATRSGGVEVVRRGRPSRYFEGVAAPW